MSNIRWDNVSSTVSGSAGTAMMDSARKSLQNSFSSLEKIMNREAETQRENFETLTQNNTDKVLSKIHSIRTPEEFSEARDSGVFENMKSQFGAALDRSAIRDALDSRGSFLRGEREAQQTYEDGQHNRDLRTAVRDLKLRAMQNDEGVLDELGQLDYRDDGEVAGRIYSTLNTARGQDRADQQLIMAWNQDHRAQNAEGRAQNAEERAQAAEGRAQEIHNWRAQEQAEQESQIARQREIWSSVMENTSDFRRQIQNNNEEMMLLARDFGIPVNFNTGDMDIENSDPDKVLEFHDALLQSGIGEDTRSVSRFINSQIEQMSAAGMFESPAEMTQASRELNEALRVGNELSQEDREALDNRFQFIDAETEASLAELEEEHQEMVVRNIFLEDVDLTSGRLERGFEDIDNRSLRAFLTNMNERELTQYIQNISVRGVEHNGERITIPPVIVESLIRQASSVRFGTANTFNRHLENFIQQNAQLIADAAEWTNTYNTRKEEYQRDHLRALTAAESAAKSNAGIVLDRTRKTLGILNDIARQANGKDDEE